MQQIKIFNHVKNTESITITPLTIKQWLSIHFGAWGWYKIIKESKNKYLIYDKFDNKINYTLTFFN